MDDQHDRDPEDERQRRTEALRALSRQQVQPAQTPPPAARPSVAALVAPQPTAPRTRRHWLAPGLALLAVGIVVASVLVWLNRPHQAVQKSVPDPVAIVTDGDGFITCPPDFTTSDLAWSPDGSRIGMIGYRQCGAPVTANGNSKGDNTLQSPDIGGMLGVWDATTGKRTRTIELDTSIFAQVLPQQVRSDATLLQQIQIHYETAIWSPDGKTVAVTFSAYSTQLNADGTTHTTTYGTGLLLVDWRTGTIQILQQSPLHYAQSFNGSATPIQATLWDLRAGKARVVNVPQALAYQWTPDGTLTPSVPLPIAAEATPALRTGALGNPIGGKQFTIWQTGSLSYDQQCSASGSSHQPLTCCPITDYLPAQFGASGAWSPDGRYLLMPVFARLGALGKLPAPAGRTVQGACQQGTYGANLAPFPLHDSALNAVMQTLSPLPPGPPGLTRASGPSQAQVAWSPDGRYMAAQTSASGGPSQIVLTIYSTSTGQAVGTIAPAPFLAHIPFNQRESSMYAQADTFLWSADGRHLLARDIGSQVMVVLGPKSLGLA